jgi:riboflavin synthase
VFSGIVEVVGIIKEVHPTAEGARLNVETSLPLNEVALGESICVNGTCLTVTVKGKKELSFDVSAESLRRTNLGDLKGGDEVNLERSLHLSDRLSGHLVFGHVDGVGQIKHIHPEGDSFLYTFTITPEIGRYLVEKGSVAVDGISLTVFDCQPTEFSVSIIPHTYEVTSLNKKKPADKVNIENDMLGKYIEKFVQEEVRSHLDSALQEISRELAEVKRQLKEKK